MRRRCFAALALVAVLAGSVSAQTGRAFRQSVNSRLDELEEEIGRLREERNKMGTLIPSGLDVYQDANDPSEPGDIKVVKGTILELDDCDATTQWSVHSGAGVTIYASVSTVYEGAGSIRIDIPAGITAVVKATKSSGSWDLSALKYLKFWLNCGAGIANVNAHFGESTYNEQNMGVFTTSSPGYTWHEKSWDISAIAAASRNAVTIFAVTIPSPGPAVVAYLDYVFADPGPSQVKAFDGDRVILLYPKVYQGTYTGTASTVNPQTITLPRKGTPSEILIVGDVGTYGHAYMWQTTMGANKAKDLAGGGELDAGVITEVGDCYFKVQGNYGNKNGVTYHYRVLWAD